MKILTFAQKYIWLDYWHKQRNYFIPDIIYMAKFGLLALLVLLSIWNEFMKVTPCILHQIEARFGIRSFAMGSHIFRSSSTWIIIQCRAFSSLHFIFKRYCELFEIGSRTAWGWVWAMFFLVNFFASLVFGILVVFPSYQREELTVCGCWN